MDAKITSDYSRKEVLQILTLLAEGGVLTAQEVEEVAALTAEHRFRCE